MCSNKHIIMRLQTNRRGMGGDRLFSEHRDHRSELPTFQSPKWQSESHSTSGRNSLLWRPECWQALWDTGMVRHSLACSQIGYQHNSAKRCSLSGTNKAAANTRIWELLMDLPHQQYTLLLVCKHTDTIAGAAHARGHAAESPTTNCSSMQHGGCAGRDCGSYTVCRGSAAAYQNL